MHQTAKALEKTKTAIDEKSQSGAEQQKAKIATDAAVKQLGEGLFQLTEQNGDIHQVLS